MLKPIFFSILLIFVSCSGMQNSEEAKRKQQNAKGEFIYRRQNEIVYTIPTVEYRTREQYPWEEAYIGAFPRITKEWFRCKGSNAHPAHIEKKADASVEHNYDCGGTGKHSLPLRGEEEFIYPILIELLNEIQVKTGKRVIITCGHRCPQHNTYADFSTKAKTSKHMIGAEVDFYIQGLENKPEAAIQCIINFYRAHPLYKGKKEFEQFVRYDKGDLDVTTQPWYNKEIFIKLYKRNEGRDYDNQHPYPYISLQVRLDRDSGEKVVYSWPKANKGFKRY